MHRIDHIVFAAPDLEAAMDFLERLLGVRAAPGGRHTAWGTRNALIGLGPATYLEIIAPDPTRSSPAPPTLFGLDGLREPRLVAWAARADDLQRSVERAAEEGVRLGSVQAGERLRPDGQRLSWSLTDPTVVHGDGLIPFLIDWGDSHHPAATAPPGCTLISLAAEHPDPDGIRDLLAAVGAGLAVRPGTRSALIATIDSPAGRVALL